MSAHSWLYHPIIGNRQTVECRRCGKFDGYEIVGYKPEPPDTPCKPPHPQFVIPVSLRGFGGDGR